MSAEIIKFPKRHRFAIVVEHDADNGWFVVRSARGQGWLHHDIAAAFADAQELAAAESLPIEVRP
jgi:hypothetical protein